MPPSSAKAAETTSYDAVRATPFTRIHGRPTRHDYESNTDTVLINKPPTEFLPDYPPAIEAIHYVYELKTQPELVQYLHACTGFPTKPSWIEAIKNRQYASWPGLTSKPRRNTSLKAK